MKKFFARMSKAAQKLDPQSPNFQAMLTRIGMTTRNHVSLKLRSSGLKRRSGALANSIFYETRADPKAGYVLIGSKGVRYAAIHEFGGTIKPTGGRKFLTIPLNKKYQGIKPGMNRGRFGIWSSKRGTAGLYDKETGEYAFVFKKEVEIPKRPYMRPGIKAARPQITKILSGYFRSIFK